MGTESFAGLILNMSRRKKISFNQSISSIQQPRSNCARSHVACSSVSINQSVLPHSLEVTALLLMLHVRQFQSINQSVLSHSLEVTALDPMLYVRQFQSINQSVLSHTLEVTALDPMLHVRQFQSINQSINQSVLSHSLEVKALDPMLHVRQFQSLNQSISSIPQPRSNSARSHVACSSVSINQSINQFSPTA